MSPCTSPPPLSLHIHRLGARIVRECVCCFAFATDEQKRKALHVCMQAFDSHTRVHCCKHTHARALPVLYDIHIV